MEKNLVAVLGNITAEEFELAIREISRKRRNDDFEEKSAIAREILLSAAEAIRSLGLEMKIPNGYYRLDDTFKMESISFKKPWELY